MNILFALAVGYQVYYANLHAHTSYSDGIGLPGQAYCYARDTARIDVLALTDHTHYLTPGTYRQEREIAESFTEPGRFVALAGQEFGSLAQFGHLSIYDAESLCPVSTSDLAGFYNWLGEVQEPAQFNHPSLEDFGDFRYYRAADRYVTTIEVVNGSGLYTPVNEDKYLAALRAGWHCAPVANQDNHRGAWGNAPGANGQIPLTGILADTLTRAAVREAILARRVYACEVKPASDRIRLTEFSIGGLEMGSSGTLGESLGTMMVKVAAETSFRQLYLYRNGELYDSAWVSSQPVHNPVWTRAVPTRSCYYFVKGEQTDGDHFWTAPIWLDYRGPRAELQFWPNPFSAATAFVFDFALARIEVFDAAGTLVYDCPRFERTPGVGSPFRWDGRDNAGRSLADGIYYVRVTDLGPEDRGSIRGKVGIKR